MNNRKLEFAEASVGFDLEENLSDKANNIIDIKLSEIENYINSTYPEIKTSITENGIILTYEYITEEMIQNEQIRQQKATTLIEKYKQVNKFIGSKVNTILDQLNSRYDVESITEGCYLEWHEGFFNHSESYIYKHPDFNPYKDLDYKSSIFMEEPRGVIGYRYRYIPGLRESAVQQLDKLAVDIMNQFPDFEIEVEDRCKETEKTYLRYNPNDKNPEPGIDYTWIIWIRYLGE